MLVSQHAGFQGWRRTRHDAVPGLVGWLARRIEAHRKAYGSAFLLAM